MNNNEDKIVDFIGKPTNKTPMEVIKEIENAIFQGQVDDILVVIRKADGDSCKLRWSSNETRWENKAAMASFLFSTVNL